MKILRIALSIIAMSATSVIAAPSGTVIGWGFNRSGEATGVPSGAESTGGIVVVAGHNLTNAVAISGGMWHSLALKADGTLVNWGNPVDARTVRPTNASVDVKAISAGNHVLALKKNGTVTGLGNSHVPPGLSNVIAVAAGEDYSLALKSNGTLVSWGDRLLSSPPPELRDVIAIAVSGNSDGRGMALKNDHTVVTWGLRDRTYCKVLGATNVVAIAAGDTHYLALMGDGTVLEWGDYGGPLPSSTLYSLDDNHPPADIAAPDMPSHLVVISNKVLNNIAAIAAGGTRSLALKRDGTVVAWGRESRQKGTEPVELSVPSGLRGVIAISAGNGFSLAITTNNPALPNLKAAK